MASPSVSDGAGSGQGRWQLSLADLSVVVLAAGLAAGLARDARDPLGTPGGVLWAAFPFARPAGLALEVAAVWMSMVLARGIIGMVRERRGTGRAASRLRFLAALSWRALAIATLLGLALAEAQILRLDPASFSPGSSPLLSPERYELWEALSPVCMVLVMIGLAMGAGARVPFARSDQGRRRPYWLLVPMAALVAVLIMGLPNGNGPIITQLILLAIEAVNNAMPPPHRVSGDSLSVRLLRAGIEAIPSAVACVWLALLVARDFERSRRGESWGTTRRGWLLRLASMAFALASGTVIVLVSIPMVSPQWFDGIRLVIEPEVLGMMLVGFIGFAAGLAARTLVPAPTPVENPRRWARFLGVAIPFALLTIVLVSAFHCLPSATQLDPSVPAIVGAAGDLARELEVWLDRLIPYPSTVRIAAWLDPERIAWVFATGTVALFVLQLAFARSNAGRTAPFDAVADSPGRFVRFVWLTAGLTAVCLVAMPTVLVLGQAIVQIRLHFDHWMAYGWPSPF